MRNDGTTMTEGLRQREGDQRLPVGNDLPSMHELARLELQQRLELGIKRYGQPLQPANGRDAARDAWEEALDGAAYGAQVVWEQDHPEHTYIGVLLQMVENYCHEENIGRIYFDEGVFVPEGVKDWLEKRGIGIAFEDAASAQEARLL